MALWGNLGLCVSAPFFLRVPKPWPREPPLIFAAIRFKIVGMPEV